MLHSRKYISDVNNYKFAQNANVQSQRCISLFVMPLFMLQIEIISMITSTCENKKVTSTTCNKQ